MRRPPSVREHVRENVAGQEMVDLVAGEQESGRRRREKVYRRKADVQGHFEVPRPISVRLTDARDL